MIVGYGYGKVQKAHNEAWIDARRKLESGLDKHYGLAENKSEYRARTAVIMFVLIPLKDGESAEAHGDCEEAHEKEPPSDEQT